MLDENQIVKLVIPLIDGGRKIGKITQLRLLGMYPGDVFYFDNGMEVPYTLTEDGYIFDVSDFGCVEIAQILNRTYDMTFSPTLVRH